ncbi:hypothetical protein JCM33374_g984 [Metschnikowia sp. JCM 33374]|nr:hypothetical protein JCM33374_g984 [Metschnikowia sp. JCM 33374]
MPKSVRSLRSSLDSTNFEGPMPVQLDATNVQPDKPSYRRASSTGTAFFSLKSEQASIETYEGQEYSTLRPVDHSGVPNETVDHADYFGATQIHRSLAAPKNTDEEALEDAELREFFPQGQQIGTTDESAPPEKLRKRDSTVASAIQTFSKKFGFWDDEFLSQRIDIVVTMFTNYIYLILGFMCALCVYWGSYYNRASRYKDLKFAVMIGDVEAGSLPPILGKFVTGFFQNSAVQTFGNFDIWNHTRLSTLATANNNSLEQEVLKQVHHQNYLAAFYVHENATAQMYRALVSQNTSFNPATDLLSVFYETGSDYNGVTNYVSSIVQRLCSSYVAASRTGPWSSSWMKILGGDKSVKVLSETPSLLTSLPSFQIIDRLPVVEQVVQAPFQIGLIYLCMFTFFQFLFTVPIHMSVASKIKGLRFVAFRMATAQGSYVVLSLAYVVLNAAFGISCNKTFGNSGFLVIWAISFWTMSAIGTVIEIMVLISIVLKPAMIGVCLLVVAVFNLAPTISPIYLCPKFYRYGYAMPVYNSYHLLQVAYFNSWKGNMGREFGILIAWSLGSNLCMPFVMKWVSIKLKQGKVAMAAELAASGKKKEKAPLPPASAAMVQSAQKMQETASQ